MAEPSQPQQQQQQQQQGKKKIYALIDYEDAYVQPLLLSALKARLPSELLVLISDVSEIPSVSPTVTPSTDIASISGEKDPSPLLLQWRQYESIDFDRLLPHPSTNLANSYAIRKALIRKHYLPTTIAHWASKRPDTALRKHVKPSVEFEVDYAEFLDDALLEAWELHESWGRNAALADDSAGDGDETDGEKKKREREWWILKPGMSERGQGIRLFSSEEELTAIFEEWDPESDDEDEDEDEDDAAANSASGSPPSHLTSSHHDQDDDEKTTSNGIITSQLRHFVAQPYIHPPLLLPSSHPSGGRKFHIRTYVLATGALQVYVYREMLALFAGKEYVSPDDTHSHNQEEGDGEGEGEKTEKLDLSRHLTNTCLQSGEREGSVCAFWSLPESLPFPSLQDHKHSQDSTDADADATTPGISDSNTDWREEVFTQICTITSELFEAAARTMSVHFQTLPNAFEIFGLDFLVDAEGKAWLLEVNAFPDFAQTGGELQGIIEGLFEGVVERAVLPFFFGDEALVIGEGEGNGGREEDERWKTVGEKMVKVLDVDLGRR